jgi:1-acyl-sn-glycerol-3-phosphate acyltransferase
MAKAGALEAGHGNAEAALGQGGIVVVYPGGDHEAFRPWKDRNRIDFAGRNGFIRLALRQQVPIVPSVSIGAHETLIVLARGEGLARFLPHLRAFRIKTQPVILGPPWGISFGLPTFPLRAQVTVQLGPVLDLRDRYGPDAADDDETVAALYDEVVSTMQATLDDLAAEREAGQAN